MLTLNLISEQQKKEIKLRHVYGFIKKVNLSLIIITIAVAIILLVAKTILQLKFNDVVEQTTLVTKTNLGYNNKVREINDKLNFVSKVQGNFIPWSNMLKSLADITGQDINLYYLKADAQNKTIQIKGKAKFRDGLLNFKDKLAALPEFSEINFPVQNILEKENIDFEINAKINLSGL